MWFMEATGRNRSENDCNFLATPASYISSCFPPNVDTPTLNEVDAMPQRNEDSDFHLALLVTLILSFLLPAAPAVATEHVVNEAVSRDGIQVVQMQELWRIDDDNEDLILGSVSQIKVDADGNIYALDRQLSHVVVLSRDGEFLRTLGREGDGPGEVRRPRDMLLLPDGSLGITQTFPGKIIKVDRDGEPAGEIPLGAGGEEKGGMFALFNALARGGSLVVAGEKMGSDPAVFSRTRFLATILPDGTEQVRLLTDVMTQNSADFVWDEERDYFVHLGGLALGPDGLIYAAPERNQYLINVYQPDGELVRVIEREFKQQKRSEEEIRMINDTRRMMRNGQDVPKHIGSHAPCISRLWVDSDNRLWVLHSRSGTDQPDGILQTYDVFDKQGLLVRQLSFACPGDAKEDRLFPLTDGRAVLVKGYWSAVLATIGVRGSAAADDDSDEASPLELVVYEMKR